MAINHAFASGALPWGRDPRSLQLEGCIDLGTEKGNVEADTKPEQQSGHQSLLGYDLYEHLLENLSAGLYRRESTVQVGIGFKVPEDLVPESEIRASIYLRLSRCDSMAMLEELAEELEDRFGNLPQALSDCIRITKLRILSQIARIARLTVGPLGLALEPFSPAEFEERTGMRVESGRVMVRSSAADSSQMLTLALQLLEGIGRSLQEKRKVGDGRPI